VGTSLDFEDYEPDSLTRQQLEAMRGPLDAGNGAGDLAVPVPNGKPGPQLCGLPGCDRPVSPGRGARYCSEAHRRRASHQRNGRGRPERAAVPPEVLGLTISVSPFEQLAALAGMLPAGWELRATASVITVSWSA
jgi:hypothetical protein